MKKRKNLKINRETLNSMLEKDQMKNVKGGYVFSIFGCSNSLCVSHRCQGIGFTVNSNQCCS